MRERKKKNAQNVKSINRTHYCQYAANRFISLQAYLIFPLDIIPSRPWTTCRFAALLCSCWLLLHFFCQLKPSRQHVYILVYTQDNRCQYKSVKEEKTIVSLHLFMHNMTLGEEACCTFSRGFPCKYSGIPEVRVIIREIANYKTCNETKQHRTDWLSDVPRPPGVLGKNNPSQGYPDSRNLLLVWLSH